MTGMDIVEKMSEYAVNNYNMDITIRNLAENVFFMNQSYISHLFAEKKGISFSAFLRMIRICHAKEFLADARWSVTDVALMSGYNDTSQFIRIFRQETGMTPKKYRIFLKNGGSENESREVEWNEENKPQPDMELLEQWISRQEDRCEKILQH